MPRTMNVRNASLEDAAVIARFNVLLAEESENEEIEYQTVLKGVRTLLTDEGRDSTCWRSTGTISSGR